MRPFLKLEPQAFPKAWEQTIRKAHGGKVTVEVVSAVIRDFAPKGRCPAAPSRKSRRLSAPTNSSLGQVLIWLHEAKRRVEKPEDTQVLEALEKIESLLFNTL